MVMAALLLGSACSGSDDEQDGEETPESSSDLGVRLGAIAAVVGEWREASTLGEARAAAEAAANLVVGPNGPGYGDRDGNGLVEGDAAAGVLPGLDGSPDGLASALDANECVVADVLGGSWTDPAARWGTMLTAIEEWRPDRNTMPSLPSHPMRIVGWATFTLASTSLDEAHEYAGHAQLHVDVSRRALEC
jgi:hypothetical protein